MTFTPRYNDHVRSTLKDERVRDAVASGARFRLEQLGVAHTMTAEQIEAVGVSALSRALPSGLVIPAGELAEQMDASERRSQQRLTRACGAEVARDRTLVKIQDALHAAAEQNPEQVPFLKQLAADVGVVWHGLGAEARSGDSERSGAAAAEIVQLTFNAKGS